MLSHAEHLEMPRDTLLKKTLFACDELSGFVTACGYVRPDGIETLEPKSVRKKLKQPSFAAGVHRDEVYRGAEELGLELDEHIANVIEALRPIAGRARAEDGLATAATSGAAQGSTSNFSSPYSDRSVWLPRRRLPGKRRSPMSVCNHSPPAGLTTSCLENVSPRSLHSWVTLTGCSFVARAWYP